MVFIPGGPGLSSATLRSMDILRRSFDLAYVDPPGTGGLPVPQKPTFERVIHAIEAELIMLRRPMVLCGHSFGGLYATLLAHRGKLNLKGLVAMDTPLSAESFSVAGAQYAQYLTPELRQAQDEWERSPSRDTYLKWVGSYGLLFFLEGANEQGRAFLGQDQVSYEVALESERSGLPKMDFIECLRLAKVPKFMFAGSHDHLLPPQALERDAHRAGFEFGEVKNAGHFITFDQPEVVAGMIEDRFIDNNKKE